MTPRAEGDRPRPVLLLLSGPNLALLGERQPEIYGTTTLAEHVAVPAKPPAAWAVSCATCKATMSQSSSRRFTRRGGSVDAIVVNAGALSHSSWALHDALAMFVGVVVELHLSNPDAREPWRRVGARTGVRRDGGGLRGTWLRARGRGRRPPLGRARRQGEPGLTCRPRSRGAASRRLAPSISADAERP